jgi:hypothetical protein
VHACKQASKQAQSKETNQQSPRHIHLAGEQHIHVGHHATHMTSVRLQRICRGQRQGHGGVRQRSKESSSKLHQNQYDDAQVDTPYCEKTQ